MRTRYIIASCIALLLLSTPAVAQEVPYNNSSNTTGYNDWTDGHEDVDLVNVSHYLSRIPTFVIGDMPGDAGAGPLMSGLLVAGFGVLLVGQSRAGLIASGTLGVFTLAALSGAPGMLPRWTYGLIVMIFAAMLGLKFKDMIR